jgi:SAM-dependent methyltransferase
MSCLTELSMYPRTSLVVQGCRKVRPGDTMPQVDARSTSDGEGYVEGIPYTYSYHPELDPSRMQATLRRAGLAPPAVATACELGFGQGLSLAIHAVAGGARWWGTDLNPDHVATLRGLIAGTGAGVEAAGQAFAGFFARDDLPAFDFIGAHGVWSWVSVANRARIVSFLQRRLRPGGVFYLSYNALPGWAPMLPLRKLLMARMAAMPPSTPLAERIDAALRDTAMRFARDPSYEEAQPGIEAELRAIRGKSSAYLAHEFFNRDWVPMDPEAVAVILRAAGLRHAASVGGERDSTEGQAAGRFRREYWVMGEPRPAPSASVQKADVSEGDVQAVSRRAGCQRLNARLLALALESPDPAWLASPVTGGGVEVGYTTMLLLEAWQRGLREPAELARDAQATLSRLGQRLLRSGEVVVDRDRSVALLAEEARALPSVTLPRLAALHALPFDA